MKWPTILDGTAAVALTIASSLLIWSFLGPSDLRQGPQTPVLPTEPFPLDGAVRKGSSTATVAIVEFADFQCPYCATFASQILPVLDQEFIQTGQVNLYFRHLPLDSIHPHARGAAVAAECAAEQGLFWPMHDALFESARTLADVLVSMPAAIQGIRLEEHAECAKARGPESVKADVALARRFGVASTPTFLVGSTQPDMSIRITDRINGAAALDVFRAAIGRALTIPGQ